MAPTRRRKDAASSTAGSRTAASRDPLRAYLQNLPVAAFLYRREAADFRLTAINPAGNEFAGDLASQSLGRRASEILGHRPALLKDLHRCWREQCSARRTLNLRFGDRLRTTHVTCVPVGTEWVVVLAEDVTASEVAQAALARSEEKYRTLVESSLQGITIHQDGRIVFTNAAAAGLTNRTVEELLAIPPAQLPQLVHPDDRAAVLQAIQNRQEGRPAPARIQYRVITRDGAERWIESVNSQVEFEGRPAWMSVAVDISEQKRVEAALRVSEENYRTLIESLPDAVFLHADGRMLLANAAALRLFGARRPEDLIGRSVLDFVPAEGHAEALDRIERITGSGRGLPAREKEIVRLDGTRVSVDVRATPVGYLGRTALLVVVRDISERLRAEQALRASEERHRVMVETGPQCVKLVAGDGRLLDMNPAGLRMIEADSLDQVRGLDVLGLVAPAHRQAYRALLRRVMAGGGGRLEFEIVGLKGTRRWLETHAVPLRDGEGRVTGMLGITGDVTERKRAEDELRRSESRYRSLVRGALYGIYRSTPEGRLLEANPALATMLGYESEAELLEADWTAAVYADPGERAHLVEEYRQADRIEGVEVRWRRKDGTPVTVRLSGRVLRDEAGKLVEYEMIVEDVTARRGLEDQLRQAQKMEGIGQLAGGVAHDFNNLLTAILGSTDLLLLDVPPEDPRREDLVAIREAGERAAGLTRQLLAFSRQQVLQPRVIDLNDIVTGMERLLRRIIGEDVELVTAPGARPALVNADPGQIEQVILNLVVNARDAMPEGGGLTIATAHVELDRAFAQRHPTMGPGAYVRLSVSDTGEGMDEATKGRIFEPFFTTKGPGRGTGLGLAMVYGIVKQSGGYIWVRSEPGRGATFDIYLPPAPERAVSEPPEAGSPAEQEGSETILVVEDDAAVRALARRALDRYGYHVLEASNGREAVDLVRRRAEVIDLMLVDVIMPEIGGRRAAEDVRQSRPDVKVLYMSGYPGSDQTERAFEPGAFLQKPFTPEALVRRVRELLDGDAAP